MQADHQIAFHVQKIRQHPVIQLRGQDLQEADLAGLFPHGKLPPGLELKGAGGDEVFGGKAGGGQPLPVEAEGLMLVHIENVVHDLQILRAVQRNGGNTQALEIVDKVDLDPLQPGLCQLHVLRLNAEGQILGLGKTVFALCHLTPEHGGVFLPDAVVLVPVEGNVDLLGDVFLRCGEVDKGELELDGGIEVIEEITPAVKDRRLVLVLRELVVDVLETDGFHIAAVRDPADAVRVHPLIRDTVLRRFLFFIRSVGSGDQRLDLLALGAGQLCLFRGQCGTPPDLNCPAVPKRRRSCWSYRV